MINTTLKEIYASLGTTNSTAVIGFTLGFLLSCYCFLKNTSDRDAKSICAQLVVVGIIGGVLLSILSTYVNTLLDTKLKPVLTSSMLLIILIFCICCMMVLYAVMNCGNRNVTLSSLFRSPQIYY